MGDNKSQKTYLQFFLHHCGPNSVLSGLGHIDRASGGLGRGRAGHTTFMPDTYAPTIGRSGRFGPKENYNLCC